MTTAVFPRDNRGIIRRAATARRWRMAVGSAVLLVSAAGFAPAQSQPQAEPAKPGAAAATCSTPLGWMDVKTGRTIPGQELLRDLAKDAVVLLGESHTSADHHRWQLQTVAALHGLTGRMVIGFEAFPRRLQGVLDDWVDGKLTVDAFLKASEWRRVWGYDAALYLPLFQFARINHIPMVALNVERTLVSQVGQNGWAAVPPQEREGLSDPAPASAGYQRELAGVYQMKKKMAAAGMTAAAAALTSEDAEIEVDDKTLSDVLTEPEFKRFVDAQLTWDRGMAEGLFKAHQKFPGSVVVGIVGAGHVESGYGIPHQLKSLGVSEQASLLPVASNAACKLVGTGYADAVFALPHVSDGPTPDRPRLGVLLADEDGGVRLKQVVPNSVAEAAGLKAGDQVINAAGIETKSSDDLVDIVAVQAPGTWLPMSIKRDGQQIDVIAKFPPRPKS